MIEVQLERELSENATCVLHYGWNTESVILNRPKFKVKLVKFFNNKAKLHLEPGVAYFIIYLMTGNKDDTVKVKAKYKKNPLDFTETEVDLLPEIKLTKNGQRIDDSRTFKIEGE